MDQEAFRKLVSTSSSIAAPSTSSRSFGKAHRRNPPTSSSSTTKPTHLKPHKLKSKSREDGYVDRAAARRSGTLAAEFEEVESLHHDFEARIAAAETEEDRQKLRDQISSVGGDAKYSVLVKGLDWGLLAQNKARLESEGGGGGGNGEGEGEAEGDLESAYQEAKGEKKEDGAGKRSREEIVEAIRRRREGKTSATSGTEGEGSKNGFRPIGFKPIGVATDKKQEEDAEYKWVNGKRMRKKKKPTSSAEEQARSQTLEEPSANASSDIQPAPAPATAPRKSEQTEDRTPSAASTTTTSRAEVEKPSITRDAIPPQSQPSPPTTRTATAQTQDQVKQPSSAQPPSGDDSEDEDIFADVGGWSGIPDTKDEAEAPDSDEEEGRLASPPPAAGSIASASEHASVDSAKEEDEIPIVPQREPSTPPEVAAVDDARQVSPVAERVVEASEPNLPEVTESAVAGTEPLPIAPPQLEQHIQVVTAEDTSKSKPKKSKWDDLDGEKDRKKKKKSKHH